MTDDLVARALTSLRNRDFAAARNCIVAFGDENPLEFQHYMIRGLSELALKDWAAARETFEEASQYFPHQPQLWFNLGLAQENLGETEEAAESFEHSLDLNPNQGDACGNLSNLYRKMGLFKNAETMAHRAYELGAPKAASLNALGLALMRQGNHDAAEKIFTEALRLEPGNAHVLANLANCATDRLDFTAAWPLFAAARAAGDEPTIRHEEGMARLLAGDALNGWPLAEARLDRPGALRTRPTGPIWRGELLAGKKLLIVAEQGLGDTIQFCRYGALLARECDSISWVVPKSLQRLFADNLPGRVFAEGEPFPDADYWLPMLSLPLAMKKPFFSDAPPAPYLRAPAGPELPPAKKNLRRIGLVWAGSPMHERAHERSMHLAAFERVWKQVPANYVAPFIGDGLEEITPQTPVMRLDKLIGDFADTAALLSQLDCLVSVDTACAHLAGALGVKTYLLLPYCPDWRWGISGVTTPWYPGMTLIRQPKYGDWDDVIGALIGLLTLA